ncbi:MAG: class I SAM-dependent methyltransferase [Ignavibacteriae bacterium]|nr:MAG: class I SAM-dependent methyltransferase [Ignavibacteriota bacterium]
MHYDPIKKVFGDVIRNHPQIRIWFYRLLGIMFLREWYVKRELRRRLGSVKEPFTVYDAGSGFGQYSYYIARRFPLATVFGIDLKDEQVADCNRFFRSIGLTRCTFAVEDLTQIQHSEKFDFILSVDVMEHIPDDIGVFRNFFRALKPGGTLLINTPSNLGGSDAHSDSEESFIGEHARNGYGAEEIQTKLESAGLKVESIRYTYGPWGDRYWKLGIKIPMQLLNISRMFFLLLPFYYVIALPLILPMMWLDYRTDNSRGTGLNVLAKK